MKKRTFILSAVVVAVAAGIVGWLFVFWLVPRTRGPMRHEAYVWQRAWTQPVRDAVLQHGTNFAELVPLKAEISWKDGKPRVARVAVDYATLAKAGRPVGIALRIGPYPGPFAGAESGADAEESPGLPKTGKPDPTLPPRAVPPSGDTIRANITEVAGSLVAEARSNHVELSELQIDFDCAESKLEGYRLWVEAIQRRVSPLRVTITALPSWLNSRAFKPLAKVATNYVLQVHSVERPKNFDAPFTLCEPRAARRAVERAGRIGIPFRVALPTYGYTLGFDASGKFLGLSAEGPRPNWPTNSQIRRVFSDPIAISALVRDWSANRPAALRGIIWYRLPTIVDNFNWRWPTLAAIVASRSLQEKLRVESRRVESGLTEVFLANEGELDISSRLAVEVRWTDARLVAGDALRDFELADRRTSAARFQTQSQPVRLRAGDKLTLGWLRFDRDCEVRCELRKL